MITHRNYFEIEATGYFELGLRKGELFGDFLHEALGERKRSAAWTSRCRRARLYLETATQALPHLVDELKGYAEGAGASFDDLWLLSLEDELEGSGAEKCTTIVTNGGKLIAHNEDWDKDAAESICVLRQTVGAMTVFELFYLNTLGGNSISVNACGFVHAINSLTHTDRQVGVPKNLVARWLAETRSPDRDLGALATLRRASGYHHCLVGQGGQVWSIECSATRQVLARPDAPFIHTNHYLSSLSALEGRPRVSGTRRRYRCASAKVSGAMSLGDMKRLCSDTSGGSKKGILNDRTIARMIVDLANRSAYVWLRREAKEGWVSYPLGFAALCARDSSEIASEPPGAKASCPGHRRCPTPAGGR
jgi:hypothetical protein